MTDHRSPATLRIGLAAVPNHPTLEARLESIDEVMTEAANRKAVIVCFPETYLPGLRGMDFAVPPPDQAAMEAALHRVRATSARTEVAMIMGMEWASPEGWLNLAWVIDRDGSIQGCQTKNQIAPSEDPYYLPGERRHLFTIDGVPFGIAICHEGWRYPETVRWAATRGAKVVFHPHVTGSDDLGQTPRFWGDPEAPYYEKAMLARAVENEIWFASVNCATRFQESATCVVSPTGELAAMMPYRESGLFVHELDLDQATGIYARRFVPDRLG